MRTPSRIRSNILNRHPFSDLYSPTTCFSRQPIVELVTADDAQCMSVWHADVQSLGFEIKMDIIRIDMRYFADVKSQALQNDLRVDDSPPAQSLGRG